MAVAEGPFHTPALRVAFWTNAENECILSPSCFQQTLNDSTNSILPSFSFFSLTRVIHPVEKEKKKKIKYRIDVVFRNRIVYE